MLHDGYVGLPELRALAAAELDLDDDQIRRYEMWRERVVTGRPMDQIAKRYGCSERQAYTWGHRFEDEGLQGLLNRKSGPKRPHKVDDETEKLIVSIRTETPEGRSITEIPAIMMERYGREVSQATVARVIKKRGLPQKKRGPKPWAHHRGSGDRSIPSSTPSEAGGPR